MLFSQTSRANSLGDCSLISDTWDNEKGNFKSTETLYHDGNNLKIIEPILKKNEYNIALLNLKTICCRREVFLQNNEEAKKSCTGDIAILPNPDNVPNSVYLFDHIFDILMRKLDGEGEFYYNSWINIGVSTDPTANARRKFMNENQTNDKGADNTKINATYKKYRSDNNNHINGFLEKLYVSNQIELFSKNTENIKIINNYDKAIDETWAITLREKYQNVCNIASYIYFASVDNKIDTTSRKNIGLYCTEKVNQRIKEENLHILLTQIQNNNTLIQNNFNQRTQYSQTRENQLSNTLMKINQLLTEVVKATPKITPNCA